jgi:hypothetical protein
MREVVLTVATDFGPFLVMQVTNDFVVATATASEVNRSALTKRVSVKCILLWCR